MKPMIPNQSPLVRFKSEMDKMFDRMLDQSFFPKDLLDFDQRFLPSANIKETTDAYIAEIEIPGMSANDLEIEISGHVLTITGKQEQETKKEEENYIHVERSYGSFHRSFTLPENADIEHIEAKSEKGILYITIPKIEKDPARRIEIKETDE